VVVGKSPAPKQDSQNMLGKKMDKNKKACRSEGGAVETHRYSGTGSTQLLSSGLLKRSQNCVKPPSPKPSRVQRSRAEQSRAEQRTAAQSRADQRRAARDFALEFDVLNARSTVWVFELPEDKISQSLIAMVPVRA
jgi:hypothetical protein